MITANFSPAALASNWLTEYPSLAAMASMCFFSSSRSWMVNVLMATFGSALETREELTRQRRVAPIRENPSRSALLYGDKRRQLQAPVPYHRRNHSEMAARENGQRSPMEKKSSFADLRAFLEGLGFSETD